VSFLSVSADTVIGSFIEYPAGACILFSGQSPLGLLEAASQG